MSNKKLVCNCWTNDYTLYQLDVGKSLQGGIECHCLSTGHRLSPQIFLSTCVHLGCRLGSSNIRYHCYIELGEWNMNDSHPICCIKNKAMLMEKK